MQVSSVNTQSAAAKAAAQGGLVSAFMAIGKTEGILGYWRGNVPQVRDSHVSDSAVSLTCGVSLACQVLRVLPYSACQLYR